ncbi:MAG: hypothetical protein MJK10_02915 [Pseudomonadales bacterium]|nr:hypothetical protein [Pseudomonadales bacterium]NRA14820.1 hypothetical protein [Oceanospirillaceae bacterium]
MGLNKIASKTTWTATSYLGTYWVPRMPLTMPWRYQGGIASIEMVIGSSAISVKSDLEQSSTRSVIVSKLH